MNDETQKALDERRQKQDLDRIDTARAIAVTPEGIVPQRLDELISFATYISKSGLAPRSFDTPEKVMVAVQTGMEAGLKPMQAIRAIYVINGAPAWRGNASLALVRASGKLGSYEDGFRNRQMLKPLHQTYDEAAGDDFEAYVIVTRSDSGERCERAYSVADAKQAKLWMKQGPWQTNPGRMLYWRALGQALGDTFPDVLLGLALAETIEEDGPTMTRRVAPRDVTPPRAPKDSGLAPDPLVAAATGELPPELVEPELAEIVEDDPPAPLEEPSEDIPPGDPGPEIEHPEERMGERLSLDEYKAPSAPGGPDPLLEGLGAGVEIGGAPPVHEGMAQAAADADYQPEGPNKNVDGEKLYPCVECGEAYDSDRHSTKHAEGHPFEPNTQGELL